MIKSLIATALMCACSSANATRQTPYKALSNYSLYGAYCFKQDFSDLDSDFSTNIEQYVVYDSNDFGADVLSPIGFYDNGYTTSWIHIRSMEVTWYPSYQYYNVHINYGEESLLNDFVPNDNLSEYSVDVQNTIIYFPQEIYGSQNDIKLWNQIFSRSSNDYCITYNGYYSFVSQNVNVATSWELYGSIITNNTLYDQITYFNGTSYSRLYDDYQHNIVENGLLVSDYKVLLTGVLIPQQYYTNMGLTGVFNYIYEPVNYDFGDMLFSIMDSPIYMLSQLFNFELFGIQFYVAFMSIATVILVCFVVRKFI